MRVPGAKALNAPPPVTVESMESMPRLKLPNAGDIGAWKELDEELSEAFSTLPDYTDPTVQIERRERFI